MKWLVASCLVLSLQVVGHGQIKFDRAKAEREVMAVLDDFMAAFNRQDAGAEERTYQFPHYRLASGQMAVLNAPGAQTQAFMNATYKSFRDSGWDHSAWKRRRVVQISDSKAHVDTEFTRYRKDGSIIGSYESLYVVTKEDGRWGIKLRSSFAQ
jgi:uncharacterized NTF2-like protein DUF6841